MLEEKEQKQLRLVNGRYLVEIGITVEEWKEMLLNDKIFYDVAKDMIRKWYLCPNYEATHNEIMKKYPEDYPDGKGAPFNGIVKGLGTRIINHLNRFEVIGTKGEGKTYFCIPFEGRYADASRDGGFIWKIRVELVQAIDELDLFVDIPVTVEEELENIIIVENENEGRKIQYLTTKYERSRKNRNAAIRIHGLSCYVCNFNFEEVYGELGKGFIEVHHIVPLSSKDEIVKVNPEKDLICVCCNCHRMIHRRKDRIIFPNELKNLIM